MHNTTLDEASQPKKISQEEAIALSEQRAKQLDESLDDIVLPEGYRIENGWVIFYPDSKSTDAVSAPPIRICSELKVVGRTRDMLNDNHGRFLQFIDPDGVIHKWSMPMELLAGDGASYRQHLLSQGLLIDPGTKARNHLASYIQQSLPRKTFRCVRQTGWNEGFSAFVLHDQTLGDSGKEPLIFQGSMGCAPATPCRGTLADSQELSKLCCGNSHLLFAQSTAFAAPLMRLLGIESGGFHFRGTSSCGKTTCLKVAAAVWGGPDYIKQWRATSNGLEGVAVSHNDGLLCLDEISQVDPKEVGAIAYMLANGEGKTRADKLGNPRQRASWKLLFLSSGEISLSAHMQSSKEKFKAGQEVRFLDIPADTQAYGCFENLHGFADGKAFANHLMELCNKNYGEGGREFLRLLLKNRELLVLRCREIIDNFSRHQTSIEASEQVMRAVTRFALVGAAGELVTELGITAWQKGKALQAAISCFEAWLKGRGGIGLQEEQQVLSMVRNFFELHGESRFSPWNEPDDVRQSKTVNRAGYRRPQSDGGDFLVFTEVFKNEVCKGYDSGFVVRVCIRAGWLMPDTYDKPTRSERLPGSKSTTRVYRFKGTVLEGSETGQFDKCDSVISETSLGEGLSNYESN